MWPFKSNNVTSTNPEEKKLEMETYNPITWIDLDKEKPPTSHDEILIRNEKGKKLLVRYLSGDFTGGKKGFYFHDDTRVKHFKAIEWMRIPD